jgi:hypothetical protein
MNLTIIPSEVETFGLIHLKADDVITTVDIPIHGVAGHDSTYFVNGAVASNEQIIEIGTILNAHPSDVFNQDQKPSKF